MMSPIGPLTVTEEDHAITGVVFGSMKACGNMTPLLHRVRREIRAYFREGKKKFSIPTQVSGTPFQCSVWNAIAKIPYGKTATYGDIALRIGRPRAARAIGSACGANPVPVLVPCHRILGSSGLGGFQGGLKKKEILLKREQGKSTKRGSKKRG